MGRPKIIVIVDPTAGGKSPLVLELTGLFTAEIINADSMQFYRCLDMGTTKPTLEVNIIIHNS